MTDSTTLPVRHEHKINPGELMRLATDCAGVSREIVMKTACNISGRKYVKVEGWQAIAVAHGCIASSRDVERLPDGFRAIGEIRRISDGVLLATAEGFVGADEPVWFGGTANGKTYPARAEYAIRAMAQTRAISRACRSAFAHVVVLIDSNLSTTPAEEVPPGGFIDVPATRAEPHKSPASNSAATPPAKPASPGKPTGAGPLIWRDVICPIPRAGQKRDAYLAQPDTIGSLYDARENKESRDRLFGFAHKWAPAPREYNGKTYQPTEADHAFRAGLDQFLDWYDKQPKEDLPLREREREPEPTPEEDDVPF